MDEDIVFIFSVHLFVRKGNTILLWAYKLNSVSHSRKLTFHRPCTGGKGRHMQWSIWMEAVGRETSVFYRAVML
jgi:hypothetical protein